MPRRYGALELLATILEGSQSATRHPSAMEPTEKQKDKGKQKPRQRLEVPSKPSLGASGVTQPWLAHPFLPTSSLRCAYPSAAISVCHYARRPDLPLFALGISDLHPMRSEPAAAAAGRRAAATGAAGNSAGDWHRTPQRAAGPPAELPACNAGRKCAADHGAGSTTGGACCRRGTNLALIDTECCRGRRPLPPF